MINIVSEGEPFEPSIELLEFIRARDQDKIVKAVVASGRLAAKSKITPIVLSRKQFSDADLVKVDDLIFSVPRDVASSYELRLDFVDEEFVFTDAGGRSIL